MSHAARMDLSKVFAQYLTTPEIPVLEYKIDKNRLSVRWANVVKGFAMPVRIAVGADSTSFSWIHPTETWSSAGAKARNLAALDTVHIDPNFLVTAKNVTPGIPAAPTRP
jgi:hypothetical protein